MRSYLKDINIVEAMLVFREGDLLNVSIQHHVDNVDRVVILLDNYDKKSEDIVKGFAKKYPDKIVYDYSTIPIEYGGKQKHKMYHRFKRFEGEIREQLLGLVREENKRKKIDILYWLDADEVPTNHFYKEVEDFWETDKRAIRMGYIHMFNGFQMFSNDHIRDHYRVFRYSDDLQAYPFRGLAQLIPDLKKAEVLYAKNDGYYIVHMSDYNLDYIDERNMYQQRCKEGHKFKEKKLWKVKKDIRELTSEEFINTLKTQPSIGTVAEYLAKYGIGSDGVKKQKEEVIKLNLGCGAFPLPEPEFVNLDKGRGYGRWFFQDGFKYHDNSVDAITISHALMYLTEEELWRFMKEAYRVLKEGGVIRITEDNTTDPESSVYGGWHKEREVPPFKCLTDAKMMRDALEQAYFKVYDIELEETYYKDRSLIQQRHGEAPRVFAVEGVKQNAKSTRR